MTLQIVILNSLRQAFNQHPPIFLTKIPSILIINQALRKQANSNIRTRVEKSKQLGAIVVNEFESILNKRSASSTLSGKQTA